LGTDAAEAGDLAEVYSKYIRGHLAKVYSKFISGHFAKVYSKFSGGQMQLRQGIWQGFIPSLF